MLWPCYVCSSVKDKGLFSMFLIKSFFVIKKLNNNCCIAIAMVSSVTLWKKRYVMVVCVTEFKQYMKR